LQKDCGEICDYGAANEPPSHASYGGCLTSCTLGPYCGDGILQQPDEQCDDGPNNGKPGYDCNESCVREIFVP
jgi:cysteine-rich repeat protein